MASSWNDDFLDLVDFLNLEGVEFVVVGAFALAQHGLPRATGDIDFFVRPSGENAQRIVRALDAFGAPLRSANVTEEDFKRGLDLQPVLLLGEPLVEHRQEEDRERDPGDQPADDHLREGALAVAADPV